MQKTTKKIRLGIIGAGAIGTTIAKSLEENTRITLIAISDISTESAEKLKNSLKTSPEITTTHELIKKSDLVIECAHKSAIKEILTSCTQEKKDLMVMSIGALLSLEPELKQAKEAGITIYAPSGAVAGLDALKAAKESRIESVTLTTTKPPASLKSAPYIEKNNINLDNVNKKTVIFKGNACAASEGFPQNINVAAAISLAGIGPKKTKVIIIADPTAEKNTHELEVTGDFGTIKTRTENNPFPENPKTSYLAAISAIAKIKDISSRIKIGT